MDCHFSLKKLDEDSLKDLVEFLMEDWPRSAPLIGKITQSQRSAGQMISVHVYIDTWPLPQLVVLENLTYKRSASINEFYPFGLPVVEDKIKLAPLLVYTRDMTTEKVTEIFNSTPFLRRCYQEGFSEFQDTEYRIVKIVKDASQQCGFQVDLLACPFIYSLTDKTKLSASIPSGYTINPLKYDHADIINTNWKFGGSPQTLERIRSWIQHSFSAGVFCSQTNELVAWGFVSEAGCISALQTKEAHRHKGLAKAVITELLRQAQNEGMTLYVYIEEENLVSQSLFQKMGFRKCQEGQVAFFTIVP